MVLYHNDMSSYQFDINNIKRVLFRFFLCVAAVGEQGVAPGRRVSFDCRLPQDTNNRGAGTECSDYKISHLSSNRKSS